MVSYIFVCAVLVIGASYVVASEKLVVCYYGTWATYRHGLGKFDVEHINADLCTHLIYTFVGINSQGTVVSLDSYLDLPDNWGKNNFGKFNALKQKNPKLKTILAVGGWNEGSSKYSVMSASPTLRQNFITSALKMVLDHGFDGFDLDWEYPNRRDSVNGGADIDNFSQLVKEMREAFDKHGLLLTAAVSAVKDMASLSYDIPTISKNLDFIGIMTYDMYGAWDPSTGHNAPLHKGEGDENSDRDSLYTVDVAVEYWLAQGCPPEKLVLGLPFYGRSFTLVDPNVNNVRAPSSGAGIAGPFTVTSGSLGYNELCSILKSESWEIRYDNQAKVPYAVQQRNWVSYDDPDSITKKIEYGLQKNIAGVMLWSIETDDFHGVCSGEDFPLLRAINRALGRSLKDDEVSATESATTIPTSSSSPVTTTQPSTTVEVTTAAPSTTEVVSTTTTDPSVIPEEDSVCKAEGITANPKDCSSFYMCIKDVDGKLVAKKFECPSGLHWDSDHNFCNYPDFVECSA